MPEPIVFISKFRIKDGALDGFRKFYQEGAEMLKKEKPGTIVFIAYLNEDATEASIVHVFPDADSIDLHVQGAEDRSKAAYEFIEPMSMELYGKPNAGVVEMMKQIDGSGVPVKLAPQPLGGFIRLKSG